MLRPLTGTARIKAAQSVIDFANFLEAATQELLADRLDPATTRRLLCRLGQLADAQAGEAPELADLWKRVRAGIDALANTPVAPGTVNFELHRARRAWIGIRGTMARLLDQPLRARSDPEPKGS